jgi:hypothetical protein
VEEIKNKRQAHFIFQRMKAAKKIQKAKDIRQVHVFFQCGSGTALFLEVGSGFGSGFALE